MKKITTINDLAKGPEEIEKTNFEGPSPENKISKSLIGEKSQNRFKSLSEKKKLKRPAQEKINLFANFPRPPDH